MPSPFDAELVNGPFGDPALLVDLLHGGGSFLIDMGDLSALPPRRLLRVDTILISHAHMDHWSGFDHYLRLVLGRAKTVRLFGPPGMIERVHHRLHGYAWNLLRGYDAELAFEVGEVGGDGSRARFGTATDFALEPLPPAAPGPVILDLGSLRVRAAVLDHGIPCLAYAIEEDVHVNVWPNRLAEQGLVPGPWLAELKRLAVSDAPPETPILARRADGEEPLPLGPLRDSLLTITRGRKLAYVTDTAWTPGNVERIVDLARGAELLFIEATFLHRDVERAAARRHLTAHQAGTIARMAGVKRVVPFHFSPRHAGEEASLRAELQAAFGGEAGPSPPA